MKFGVIAVGYNRPKSLRRLIDSLLKAYYVPDIVVDLIISIDYSDKQEDVLNAIKNIKWDYGLIYNITHNKRLGLREHILQCGDLSEKYDAIIMLEDDIVVSPYYFKYALQAILFYHSDSNIAGISLYKHETVGCVQLPFIPQCNGFDAYLLQYAQSWGQCWTNAMWKKFRAWYDENKDLDLKTGHIIPDYIASWGKQSWLRYFMRYMAENKLYFVYPYQSLSTNMSETGVHNNYENTDYQVPLLYGDLNYRFPQFDEAVKYDMYFERVGIEGKIFPELKGNKILDLYGGRCFFSNARYVITTNELPYLKCFTIALKYRPIEVNCLYPEEGTGINIFDTSIKKKKVKSLSSSLIRYSIKGLPLKKLVWFVIYEITRKVVNKFRRF